MTTTEGNFLRLQPSLPVSQLINLRECAAGFGVFALQDIPEETTVLETNSPNVRVIFEDAKQKTCAWCFKYNAEEDWTIGIETCPGLSFCCEDCKASWRNKYGDEGLEAFAMAHKFLRSDQENSTNDAESSLVSTEEMSEELFDKAWSAAEAQAELIHAYRCASEDHKASLHSATARTQEEAFENAIKLRIYDADMMMLILDNLLSPASEWEKVKTLSITQPRRTAYELSRGTHAFLHLHCILPVSVLKKGRLTRAMVEYLIGAKKANSFMIQQLYCPFQQGYAIWVDASFFNHSCSKNVYSFSDGHNVIFRTARDVLKGEELCITYQGYGATLAERRKLLEDSWGFECQCTQCLEEAGDSKVAA